MSIEMVSAVLALRGVTPYEKLVLLAFAEHCRDGARLASPGLDDDATSPHVGMLRRTALGRTKLWEVTQRLLDVDRPGGPLLRSVRRGQKHVRAEYELLIDPVAILGAEAARTDTSRSQRSHSPDAEQADPQRSHSPDAEEPQHPRPEFSASADDVSASAQSGRLPEELPEQPPAACARSEVIVVPGDRAPSSPESIAGRLHSHGVDWSPRDITKVRRRLVTLLGNDARAEGQADGVLVGFAQLPQRQRIRSLGAFMSRLSDDDLLARPEVVSVLNAGRTARRTTPTTVNASEAECDRCSNGWLGEDAEGRPVPCPVCRPRAAAQVAARTSAA